MSKSLKTKKNKHYFKPKNDAKLHLTKYGDFATLGEKHGTDKITHHGYYRFYPFFLEKYRKLANSNMLEIGVLNAQSILLWRDYFPSFFVFGFDIDKEFVDENIECIKGDQSNMEDVSALVAKIKKKKSKTMFIIDDGSHIPEHQVMCFEYLFAELLEWGGTYIIEDVETSYWTKGGLYGYDTRYGLGSANSCVELFKIVLEGVNWEFLTEENRKIILQKLDGKITEKVLSQIGMITFAQNCIIITKKSKQEFNVFWNRKYRYRKYL